MADAAASAVRPRTLTPELGPLAVGAAATVGIGTLGAADGGYFQPAWGWTALVALWLVVAWLVLGRAAVHGGRLALVFLGGIVGLGAWTWLSLLWTDNSVQTAIEGFRVLAYAAVTAALVVVVRREAAPALLYGTLAAIVLLSSYGLATRLFPDRLGTYDPVSTYRLSEPLGYWNSLGLFVAIGLLLALGAVARDHRTAVRAAGAAAFVVLVPALYFTFSRGAWIALFVGIAAAVALDPRRLQLVVALLVAGTPGLVAAWVSSRSDALTQQDSPLSSAASEGHEVAIVVVILALVGAAATIALAVLERRIVPSRAVRLGFASALAVLVVGLAVGVLVRHGGPIESVEKAYDAFRAPPPERSSDLGGRLFTLTGSYRVDIWRASWDQYADHPLLGDGAGTYEQYWLLHRTFDHKVRDAHNLYLETLGELGPLGLALLLVALAAPVAAAFAGRRHPVAACAFGAYVAYLVHAGVDWDWELPAVTLAAFASGAALLAMRGGERRLDPGVRTRTVAGAAAVLLAGVAFVGLIGSSAASASEEAATADSPDWDKAEDEARKATRWESWSSEPWQRLGEAQLGRGEFAAAQASFRKAIDKEPTDWLLWFRLAEASLGAARNHALDQAERLNPLSPEIRELREETS